MRNTQPEPLSVDISEACRLIGLGRSKLYELLTAGEIQSVKVGKRRLVPMASLRAWLARLQAGATLDANRAA
jgi:excisionase family DNA binding protein